MSEPSTSSSSTTTTPQGTFRFVLIPADENQAIQELTADKAGGLSDDALIAHARKYFSSFSTKKKDYDAAEKKEMVAQIRKQLVDTAAAGQQQGVGQLQAMDDDALFEMFHNSDDIRGNCEISAVTVPTERNGHTAVSLYYAMMNSTTNDDYDNTLHSSVINKRATQLLVACGHSSSQIIYGDAFVGRAIDDEIGDIWERVDFLAHDANPDAEWCKIAASPGGGGGSSTSSSSGKSNAASLSHLIMGGGGGGPPAIVGSGNSPASTDALFGTNGVPVHESWGTWTQSKEEMELKLVVDGTVTSKQVQVQFTRSFIKITVLGQVMVEGKPFDAIQADDCTYTLQTTKEGIRELCVTLAKAQEGRTWSWAVR